MLLYISKSTSKSRYVNVPVVVKLNGIEQILSSKTQPVQSQEPALIAVFKYEAKSDIDSGEFV